MADNSSRKFKFISPGVFVNEIDNSQVPADPDDVGPLVIGTAARGPMNKPITVSSFNDFVEVFGNNPKVFNWYIDDFYQKLFYSGRIETTLVELIRLRLANIHGCAFCNKGDSVHALEAGISQQQIDNLDDPKEPLFSKRERKSLVLEEVY